MPPCPMLRLTQVELRGLVELRGHTETGGAAIYTPLLLTRALGNRPLTLRKKAEHRHARRLGRPDDAAGLGGRHGDSADPYANDRGGVCAVLGAKMQTGLLQTCKPANHQLIAYLWEVCANLQTCKPANLQTCKP